MTADGTTFAVVNFYFFLQLMWVVMFIMLPMFIIRRWIIDA